MDDDDDIDWSAPYWTERDEDGLTQAEKADMELIRGLAEEEREFLRSKQ